MDTSIITYVFFFSILLGEGGGGGVPIALHTANKRTWSRPLQCTFYAVCTYVMQNEIPYSGKTWHGL